MPLEGLQLKPLWYAHISKTKSNDGFCLNPFVGREGLLYKKKGIFLTNIKIGQYLLFYKSHMDSMK